jgi:hypothetical protein
MLFHCRPSFKLGCEEEYRSECGFGDGIKICRILLGQPEQV